MVFGLRISEGCSPPVNVVSIGRSVPYPIYFMKRSGKPVMRWAKRGPCAEHGEAAKTKDRARA